MAEQKVIGFGTNEAMKGETPIGIKWIYRTLLLASSIFALVQSTYPEIPIMVSLQIYKALALGNGAVYLICQQFGWVVPKQNTQP